MNKTLIGAAALFLMGAPLALAANSTTGGSTYLKPTHPNIVHVAAATPTEQCTALEKQFKGLEATHKTNASWKNAEKMRDEGQKLCAENKAPEGVKKMEDGLKLLGVTPALKS